MDPSDRRFEKGFFTRIRFAVATVYPAIPSRKRLFGIGAIAGVVLAIVFVVDASAGRATMVAGKLSESHALFAKDCSTCHTPVHGATNANCESCHQQSSGDQRAYSLARHYQYKSSEVDRTSPKSGQLTCANCHREHQGRQHSLTAVADKTCLGCHDVGSFSKGHPEFEFAAKKLPNNSGLHFTHITHVREVMTDRKITDAEQACLSCHIARPDGRFFQPISYAKSCDGCHLQPEEKTAFVPLRSAGTPGVLTLAEIRRLGTPGSQWADYWSAAEFTEQGGAVRKSPVFHADPWVLYNLKRLRREMYPTAELADLLRASAERPAGEARALYEEAIKTLEGQMASLRGNASPDVQRELDGLRELLAQVRHRLDEPFAPLDVSRFAVTAADRAPGLDEAAYRPVIDALTKPCQKCHFVDQATIRRVQTDQRTLVRAEFTHKAHVIQAGCVDCHSVIPFREYLANDAQPTAARDRAEIHNLPSLATCQSCHSNAAAPTRCTSCHLFHPDKSHFANLSR